MRYQDDMDAMFDALNDLTLNQRAFVKARYRFLLAEYRRRCRLYSVLFYAFRITMTVGSLAVPAMLSLKTNGPTGEDILYWFTWGMSLAVTTANGLLTLFKLDKRFFMIHAVAERLRTETWQFLTLSGRYSGRYGGVRPSHTNQYVLYCSQIEKIRMNHIEDEYIRPAGEKDEKKPSTPVGSHSAAPAATPSGDVPSPPDPSALRSPPPAAPKKPIRSESTDSLGGADAAADAVVHIQDGPSQNEKETASAMSLYGLYDGSAMPPPGPARNPVLSGASTVSPFPAERR
jgi:hypothetical protein